MSARHTLSSNSQDAARPFPLLQSQFLPETIATGMRRSFHVSSRNLAEEKVKTETKPEAAPEAKTEKPEEEPKKESEGKEEGKSDEETKKEKKEDLPPPPPHGDKTPWQVFMETMQSEFKQSKEWNESTKQLAAGANQVIESEKVRKAREAYEATTGAVANTAGKVLKTTGGAVAKGAQWTWETPVMKVARKGANITGEVLDKATKPIRETEAFKNVKDVIDDGSSSRYGGWVEKEERRKKREEYEKLHGKPMEHFEEDPK